MLKKRAVLVALLLIFLLMANAMAQSAEDITGQCQVEYNARGLNWKKMSDGDLNTLWKSKELKQQTLTFQLPAEMAGGGVYLTFKEALPAGVSWTAQYQTAEDQWQSGAKGELTYLNTFVPVQGNTFRLIFEKDKKFTLSIREIRVFSSGELPAEVQMWRTPEQADALVVLSGCGEQKLSASIWKKESSDTTVVAVMAKTNALKTLELLDELWSQGVVNYPALGQFKATSSSSAAKVASLWKTKKMDTFLTEVYRDYRPERVYAPEENSTGADGAAGLSARRSIPLAGTIQWDLNSGKDHGIHIPSELYALQGEGAWLTGSWDSETMIPQMMREELGQVERADASAFIPEGRDTEGYLTEGTFTYADEENGVWIYLSKDLQVTITHCFEPQTPLTWFEADIKMRGDEAWENAVHEKGNRWAKQPDALARDNHFVFAITTDNYNIRRDSGLREGVIIRDGEILYDDKSTMGKASFPPLETMMLDQEGVLSVYGALEHTAQEYLDMGAKQVYSFGPYLIRDGEFRVLKTTYDKAREPRLAFGMIEPGHYCAVLMEGRIKERSKGSDLMTMGRILYLKGCDQAINLDGGHSAVICFMGEQVNKIGSLIGKGYGKPRNTTEMLGVGHYE